MQCYFINHYTIYINHYVIYKSDTDLDISRAILYVGNRSDKSLGDLHVMYTSGTVK